MEWITRRAEAITPAEAAVLIAILAAIVLALVIAIIIEVVLIRKRSKQGLDYKPRVLLQNTTNQLRYDFHSEKSISAVEIATREAEILERKQEEMKQLHESPREEDIQRWKKVSDRKGKMTEMERKLAKVKRNPELWGIKKDQEQPHQEETVIPEPIQSGKPIIKAKTAWGVNEKHSSGINRASYIEGISRE